MTQTITENIYASVTHNISQKSTAKNAKTKAVLSKRLLICQKLHLNCSPSSLVHAWSRLLLSASKNGRIDG